MESRKTKKAHSGLTVSEEEAMWNLNEPVDTVVYVLECEGSVGEINYLLIIRLLSRGHHGNLL